MYKNIRSNIPEKAERTITLEQILSTMERKIKEEEYYHEKPFTEEELERRRKQVLNRKKLNIQ